MVLEVVRSRPTIIAFHSWLEEEKGMDAWVLASLSSIINVLLILFIPPPWSG